MTMRVALATCRELPEPDHDEDLVVDALARRGIEVDVLAWDDPAAPFADRDLVVLRSTWNYHQEVDRFLAWVARTEEETVLYNPAHVVRDNAKKTYLRDLEARGVPIVPTEFVSRGDRSSIAEIAARRGWDTLVVKPTVSAGSFRTQRFDRDATAEAQRFLDELVRERDAMVQPWMPTVETYGERSLVWIDGAVTHAIRKSPRLLGGAESVSGELPVADDERELAARVLAPLAEELLYARVDVVRDEEAGVLRIMELELIEPSLFFVQCPRAVARFADAVAARLG